LSISKIASSLFNILSKGVHAFASIKDKSSISFSSDAGNSLFNHISSDAQIIP